MRQLADRAGEIIKARCSAKRASEKPSATPTAGQTAATPSTTPTAGQTTATPTAGQATDLSARGLDALISSELAATPYNQLRPPPSEGGKHQSVRTLTHSTFESDVSRRTADTAVLLTTSWCTNCAAAKDVWARLATGQPADATCPLQLCTLDVTDEDVPSEDAAWRATHVPAMVLARVGCAPEQYAGEFTLGALRAWLQGRCSSTQFAVDGAAPPSPTTHQRLRSQSALERGGGDGGGVRAVGSGGDRGGGVGSGVGGAPSAPSAASVSPSQQQQLAAVLSALQACAAASTQTLELLPAALSNVGESSGGAAFTAAAGRLMAVHRAAVDEQLDLVSSVRACAPCMAQARAYQREAGTARLRLLQAMARSTLSSSANPALDNADFLMLLEGEAAHHLSTVTAQLKHATSQVAGE
jgi:hypothetical protein